MANRLHQPQRCSGSRVSPSGESSKGSGLLPGAIGGLRLLVAQIVTQIVGEEAPARAAGRRRGGGGTVLWNKYQQKMRAQNTSAQAPETRQRRRTDVDPRKASG